MGKAPSLQADLVESTSEGEHESDSRGATTPEAHVARERKREKLGNAGCRGELFGLRRPGPGFCVFAGLFFQAFLCLQACSHQKRRGPARKRRSGTHSFSS